MKKILKQLLPFIKKFKKHVILNVIFNILTALFTSLSLISIIPMLDVLFDKTNRVTIEPIYSNNIGDLVDYGNNLLIIK